jgi:O-methyltransferase
MSAFRTLAGLLYRWPIPLFDQLNANVQFRQAVRTLHGNPQFAGRQAMYEWIHRECVPDTPLTYLEFGVYQGASLRMWCALDRNPGSRFYGFDSFEGLPEDWTNDKPAGTFSTAVPKIDDKRCHLVTGLFHNTLYGFLAGFEARGQLIIHLDCDLYSSALFCLMALDRWLVPGVIVIFDEFYDLQNEFAAYRDWLRASYKDCVGLASTPLYRQVALKVRERQVPPAN